MQSDVNEVCPLLPPIAEPVSAKDSRAIGQERGESFYKMCLEYAQTKWIKGLPAQALLQLNRAMSADLTGDEEYLQLFYDQVFPKMKEYKPDFILVSAGFDAHRDDPLASLNLTEHTYMVLTSELKKLANMFSEGRIISMLEGGYDLNALSSSVLEHLSIFQSED